MNYLHLYFMVALVFTSGQTQHWRQWEYTNTMVNMRNDAETIYQPAMEYFINMYNIYYADSGQTDPRLFDRISHTVDGLSEAHKYINTLINQAIAELQTAGYVVSTAENEFVSWAISATRESDYCSGALSVLERRIHSFSGRYILNCIAVDISHFQYLTTQYVNSIINVMEEFYYYVEHPDVMEEYLESSYYEMDQCYSFMYDFVQRAASRSNICAGNSWALVAQLFDDVMDQYYGCAVHQDYRMFDNYPLQTEPEVISRVIKE